MGHSAAITKRANRRELDQYFTPVSATLSLTARVPIRGQMFECCAGDGAIADVLRYQPGAIWRNDIDLSMPHLAWTLDATDVLNWEKVWTGFDWVVSNPPFNQAAQIIPLAYEHASVGIAMLLRLSYLEPTKDRGYWLNEHPPTQMIVLPRISFTGDGKTDSVTCAWMVWEKHKEGTIVIERNPKFEVGQS
jgi:hypothetical protein